MSKVRISATDSDTHVEKAAVDDSTKPIKESAGTVLAVALVASVLVREGGSSVEAVWSLLGLSNRESGVGVGFNVGVNFILGRADTKAMLAGRHVVGRRGCLPWR